MLRGGPWNDRERKQILYYCHDDVLALDNLLTKMAPLLDLPYLLLRGRSMKAVARMEHFGIPIDVESLNIPRSKWPKIQDTLIERIDSGYGVYEGRTFKSKAWEQFVRINGIPWPTLASGKLDLKDETFREMSKAYPIVVPIHELRTTLSKMKLSDLSVGSDGRNRCLLSPFSSKTGRNQPSNSRFIFGPSTWIRGLIRPPRIGVSPTLTGLNKSLLSRPPYQRTN